MTKADEIVKARLAGRQAREVARREQTRKTEIGTWTRYLSKAIPRLLILLERRDYPDAVLLDVSASDQRTFFGRKPRSVEMAAWLLDDERWEEGGTTVHLLSDGRLVCGSNPVAVSEIRLVYSEEGARHFLERAYRGVKKLTAQYEGTDQR
jgi:hypothetical protein